MKLYVVVVQLNEPWAGDRPLSDVKANLDALVRLALGFRGKITGSELVTEDAKCGQHFAVRRD